MTDYDGPERREYCVAHCQLNETAKKAVPRWAFMSALTAMIMISIAFVGINETRLTAIETNLEKRLAVDRERYAEDVHRFYVIAERNGEMLVEIKASSAETKAMQNLILKKVKLID